MQYNEHIYAYAEWLCFLYGTVFHINDPEIGFKVIHNKDIYIDLIYLDLDKTTIDN